MKLGKVIIIVEGNEGLHGPIDLDDPKIIEEIAKSFYENPEHPDHKWTVGVPWDSLRPIDKALETEDVEFTLKALLALARKTPLAEESKK